MTRRIVSSWSRMCFVPLALAGATWTTSAVAAEGDSADAKKFVAMAPQQDQGSQTPPSGANTVGGTGGATVTLGGDSSTATGTGSATGTPGATPDQPKEEKKEEKKGWIDRFAGSSLYNQTSANLNTFFPALQPNRDATIDTYFLFGPRFAINKDFQIRGRLGLSYEFTNSDETTYRNEPMLTDTGLSLFYRGIPAFANIKLQPSIGVALPTSKASLARTMYFNPSLGLQASYSNEHFLGGEFGGIFIFSYAHPVYNARVAARDPAPYAITTSGGSSAADGQQISPGPMNVSDALSFAFLATQEWGKFEPGLWMQIRSDFVYRPKEVPGVKSLADSSNIRNATYFSFWLDYHLNDWLTPELGYYMSRRLLADDGKYGNPFFSEYQDMRVYLGANIQLDSLYKTLAGTKGESGVVRAKNTSPMMAF